MMAALMAFLLALAAASGVYPTGLHDIAALENLAGGGAGGVAGDGAANLVTWARPAGYDGVFRFQPPLTGSPGGDDGGVIAALPVSAVFGGSAEPRRAGTGDVPRHAAASGLFTRRVPTAPPFPPARTL